MNLSYLWNNASFNINLEVNNSNISLHKEGIYVISLIKLVNESNHSVFYSPIHPVATLEKNKELPSASK